MVHVVIHFTTTIVIWTCIMFGWDWFVNKLTTTVMLGYASITAS